MSHRVIYVEKCEYLKLYLDNLKVEIQEGELTIPISDIQILIIDNYRSSMSVPLINKLMDYNVCTILCGIDHLPKTTIMPINGNFATSGHLYNQIEWETVRKEKAHQLIIKQKILNQIEILKQCDKKMSVISKMFQFCKEVEIGDKSNREGLSAKMYFRELFGDDFIRFEEDVINAGLNYGYSILRSLISSIVVAKGYLPNFGIFHKGKQNMFNLSDDIIEVFRPIVDQYVYVEMIDELLFKQKHREDLIKIINKKVYIDGKKQTIANAISIYLDSVFRFLENETEIILFPTPTTYDL